MRTMQKYRCATPTAIEEIDSGPPPKGKQKNLTAIRTMLPPAVVRLLDSAIYWINPYLVGNVTIFRLLLRTSLTN